MSRRSRAISCKDVQTLLLALTLTLGVVHIRISLAAYRDLPPSFLLLSEESRIRGLAVNDTTGKMYDAFPPLSVTRAIGIGFDAAAAAVYWTDSGRKAIMKSSLIVNVSTATTVVPALEKPEDVAVDWAGQYVFYTDTVLKRIGMASLDGYFATWVIESGLDKPRAIALDPEDGRMYWTDWGKVPRIERAHMSGAGREVLVNTSIVYPNGLALDLTIGRLYWVDAKLDVVESCHLNGSGRRVIGKYEATKTGLHPFGLALFRNHLYWTDWSMRGIVEVGIDEARAKRVAGTLSNAKRPMGIAAYDSQRVRARNGCSSANGGCEQLCQAAPNRRRVCRCTYGRTNGDRCRRDDSYVLYADIDSIRASTFAPNATHEANFAVVSNAIPYGVDYAKSLGVVVWAEESTGRIASASYPLGRTPTVLVDTRGGRPTAVAYDWMSANLYYVDKRRKEIVACRLDGGDGRARYRYCKAIVVTDLGSPTSIAVDPAAGYMYWTDADVKFNRIERSYMNGDGRQVVVVNLDSPRAVALGNGKLYWTEFHSNKIGVANLDGTEQSVLISKHPLLEDPNRLALHNGYMYITSGAYDYLLRARLNGSDLILFRKTRDTPDGIVVVHADMQMGSNMCSFLNGGCRQLCFPVPNGGRTCACGKDETSQCLPDVELTATEVAATVTLECRITNHGVPFVSVLWLRGNETIAKSAYDDASLPLSNEPAVVILQLNSVRTGLYACKVVNEYGTSVSSVVAVAVAVPPLSPTSTTRTTRTTTKTTLTKATSSFTILYIVSSAGILLLVLVALIVFVWLCRRRRRKRSASSSPSQAVSYVANVTRGRYSSQTSNSTLVATSPLETNAVAYPTSRESNAFSLNNFRGRTSPPPLEFSSPLPPLSSSSSVDSLAVKPSAAVD